MRLVLEDVRVRHHRHARVVQIQPRRDLAVRHNVNVPDLSTMNAGCECVSLRTHGAYFSTERSEYCSSELSWNRLDDDSSASFCAMRNWCDLMDRLRRRTALGATVVLVPLPASNMSAEVMFGAEPTCQRSTHCAAHWKLALTTEWMPITWWLGSMVVVVVVVVVSVVLVWGAAAAA